MDTEAPDEPEIRGVPGATRSISRFVPSSVVIIIHLPAAQASLSPGPGHA